jgi:4-amino-4-deoxy-L-arabinose transferase-like glycosyltransferase
MDSTRTDKAAYILITLYVVFLVFFGWKFHPIENIHSPENDGYVAKADLIRQGHIPKDPYHPLLYPLLTAGAGSLLDDTFAGGRLVSSLFAGVLILFTYLLSRRYFSRKVGIFAALGLMLNQHIIIEGVHAAGDITFTALTTLVLYLCVGILDHLDYRAVPTLALAFSAAFLVRYQAVLILPIIIIALCYSPSLTVKKRAIALMIFAAAMVLFLMPHFYLSMRMFGSPLYNENWKNLAFRQYGGGDFSYYDRTPFHGWMSVITSSPRAVLLSTAKELMHFIHFGITDLAGGQTAGGLLVAASLFGAYNCLVQPCPRNSLIFSWLAIYIIGITGTYFTWSRYMLPILPLGYILAGSFIFSGAFQGDLAIRKHHIRGSMFIAVILLFMLAGTTLNALSGFIKRHPVKEVETAVALQNEYGSGLRVLGTYPFSGRHVKYWYEELERFHADECGNEIAYYKRLGDIIRRERIDYLIIGKMTLNDRPTSLLSGSGTPSFLSPIIRNEDVTVYKIITR